MIEAAVYAQWHAYMAELATCPNVMAKLGGINMEVNGFSWYTKSRWPTSQALVDATRHYDGTTLEHFGPSVVCLHRISPWIR